MASARPTRKIVPTHRFGIDGPEDSSAFDDEPEQVDLPDMDENAEVDEKDTDEEEEEESDDDEASNDEVWVFVSPGTDQVLHPLIFTGQPGWRADVRVDDLETPGDYCDQFLPPATENDDKPRRRCKKCYKDGKKAIKTRYFCDGCDNKPELCVDCFIPWHADRA